MLARRGGWRAAAVMLAAAALCGCTEPRPGGVVLISLDTLRRDRLNCYGYRERRVSPRIDALARDSVLFESAVAASPWTTPSHMTLFTSLAPSSHGITTPFQRLMQDVRNRTVERLPEARVTLAEALAARGFATAAFTGGATLDPAIGFAQGFSLYDLSMFKLDDANMARMKAWLGEQRGRPFFLFWHTFEVHEPYLETDFVREGVPEAAAREVEEALGELERHFGRAPVPEAVWARLEGLRAHHRALAGALYDGGVLSADRRVGELMDFLKQAGLYDQTLVVLTSDHGEELWDREPGDMFGAHGHSLYEEMVGVPLLVKLPKRAHAGVRISAPAPAVDLMPTILDVMGVPAAAPMEGRSLRPLWERRDSPARTAFSEALAFESEQKGLRTDRYKYIVTVPPADVERHGRRYLPPEPERMLFDLLSDPGERTNLLAHSGRQPQPAGGVPPSLVEALDRTLRGHVAALTGQADKAGLSAEALERLKAMGYVQ